MSTKCIICYTDLPPQWSPKKPPDIFKASSLSSSSLLPEELPGMELQGQVQQKDLLSKHLDVIFILRNIFEIPLNQLSFFLRHCPSIENWITTCAKCEKFVQDYQVIYRKGQEAKRRLIQIVKETYDKDQDDLGMVSLDITDDKCRQFISEHNYKVITNPFIEGDLRARELLKSEEVKINPDHLEETIEVKEELPELEHLPENIVHSELLNEYLLDPVNITTANGPSPSSLNPTYHHDDNDDTDHWNEDLFLLQPDEVPPIINSKPIRKNISRLAKNIAKSKTEKLLRKPDKSLIPRKPKRVKLPKKVETTRKPKRKRGRPRKYFTLENPAPVFEPEEPEESEPEPELESELEQVDQEEITPEPPQPPPSPKFIYIDDVEEYNEDIPVNECNDDDFEVSDIDAAVHSSDFEISEDDEKSIKYKKRKSKSRKSNNWKLKCPEADCSEEFDRRGELNAHLLEIHQKLPKPPVIGQRKYPDECYSFSENRKRQFQIKIPSKCELCLKTFASQGSLRSHMRLMDELRWPHHCKICGKGDTSKASMEKHEALCQTGEALLTLVTCPAEDCGIILSSIVSLETHYRHHHRDLEQQPCTILNCPEMFFTKEGLEIHLKDKHKEDKPFNCDHCNQGFISKRKVEEHMKRVVEREAVKNDPTLGKICNYCGKTFVTASGLRYHVGTVHENKVKYSCEHCGKGSSGPDRLNIHLWKVHGRRDVTLKFRCEMEGCGRICTNKGQFEAHKARHAGTPQLCCEECGKEFYEEHHLKEHVEAMHESKKKGEKVKCEICGMEFGYWKYMERHRRTVHENKKRKPKKKARETESMEMKEEENAGVGKEQVFEASGQQFNLQIS